MNLYKLLRIDSTEIGKQFGIWTQIGPSFAVKVNLSYKHRYAICQCRCGAYALHRVNTLRTAGGQKCASCRRSLMTDYESEADIWRGMIRRCHNPNDDAFRHYGGRGISVCDRWRNSFANFLSDMGPRPSTELSIDRYPDNDGNYEPSNCRWATVKQQLRNTRQNRLVEYDDRRVTVGEISEIAGIPIHVMFSRLNCGWSVADAMRTPYVPGKKNFNPAIAC